MAKLVYPVKAPCGERGAWKIREVDISDNEAQAFNLGQAINGGGRFVFPGKYKILSHNGNAIMSNTPSECEEHRHAIAAATGRVLITGLGLGMFLQAILEKPDVTRVTVIEKAPEVIELVGPAFANDDRVEIINADAFEWKPPKDAQYDFCWHDIWPSISSENLREMGRLRRKFSRRAKLQGCWAQDLCKRQYYRERRRVGFW